jgi:DNase/tRNase domain of colicin-like bacteriocin
MRKFLFLLIFIFSVSTASNVLATGAWQSCSGTGPIGSAASVCQDLVKQAGESYVYSHMHMIDDSTASCYAKYKNADGTFGSGSPDMVGSACKISAEEPKEETAQAPYDPQSKRDDTEDVFGAENVTSTTTVNNPNQRVNSNASKGVEAVNNCRENKAVKVEYKDPLTGEAKTANIPYNNRGLPVFDDVAKFTTRIDKSKSYDGQFSQATRDLKAAINSGTFASSNFTAKQLADIQSAGKTISEYTWHHNADNGSMQLVPRKVHDAVKHIGQGALCKGK